MQPSELRWIVRHEAQVVKYYLVLIKVENNVVMVVDEARWHGNCVTFELHDKHLVNPTILVFDNSGFNWFQAALSIIC